MPDAPAPLQPIVRPRFGAIGFGCSALIAGRTRRESLHILHAAWEAGIRHFDTARVYGTGDAEAVLGAFAKGRRDDLTIATKFGIQPAAHGHGGKVAKRAARRLLRRSSYLAGLARRASRHAGRGGRFSGADARASLGTSLHELATDHVDLLLLHDCEAADWEGAELQSTMADLVQAGQVRTFGSATDYACTRTILTGPEPRPAVVQFNSDALNRNAVDIANLGTDAALITYQSLGALYGRLSALLVPGVDPARAWSNTLDIDVANRAELARLLLAHAIWINPYGTVLFSSGDPHRIAANAAVAQQPPFAADQLRAFERLLADTSTIHV